MKQRDQDDVEIKLSCLASNAEELYALLFDAFPEQAAIYQKIANKARQDATCMRVHGTLPAKKPAPPLVEAARAATNVHRQLKAVSHLIPKKG